MFSAIVTKKLLKESTELLVLDSTLSFFFYRFNLFFWVFFDICNRSYSIPCSFGIIFVFLNECLAKICLIDSCKFVNEVFVIFESLEKCFFTSSFFTSTEFAIYNAFLLNWQKNFFCQPWFLSTIFPLMLSLVIGLCMSSKLVILSRKSL